MNPKINAPISERTQKYDGIIALSDVTFDKDNLDLYGQDESNYFESKKLDSVEVLNKFCEKNNLSAEKRTKLE